MSEQDNGWENNYVKYVVPIGLHNLFINLYHF